MDTGLANENAYFELVRADLEDALGARATLIETPQAAAYRRPGPLVIRVGIPGGTHVVELTRRAPVFKGNEAKLVTSYAQALQAFGEVPRVFATTASEDVLTRAIAVRCSQGQVQAQAVESVIQTIIRHATRTYEGTRVAVNVCVDMNLPGAGTSLSAFLNEPWAPILGSGLNSAVLLASDGSALRVIDLPAVPGEPSLAPEPFAPMAAWTSDAGRVGLSITRSGEIYVFEGGELLLARRNSHWRAFPLTPLLESGWFGTTARHLTPAVKRTVLCSLIDASAAHHGACLGIVHKADVVQAVNHLVEVDQRWNSPGNQRRVMFNELRFLDLSRRQRLELLSMDGATLIDQSGVILAAGAILSVDAGSPGGGRTAAARAISEHGIGIKVSQDGPVKAYVRVGDQVVQQFAMG